MHFLEVLLNYEGQWNTVHRDRRNVENVPALAVGACSGPCVPSIFPIMRWLAELWTVFFTLIIVASTVGASETHAGDAHVADKHSHKACTTPVHLSEEAEMKPGGALYEGPLPKEASAKDSMHMSHGGNIPKPALDTAAMPAMAGAHNIHKGMHGGDFFMAQNKLHHLEALYSDDCGFQLFLYNAFTEPIRVHRFQAVLVVLSMEKGEGMKAVRFLAPSVDGGYLHAPLMLQAGASGTLYDAELYVNFPKAVEAVQFDLILNVGVE
jgi:hypothetical protein